MIPCAHENNRKGILGEFGVSIYADIDSRVQWVRLVREEAESRGMVWIFWDFFDQDELGALYNQSSGYWRREILEALLPEERWPYEEAGGNQCESCIRELTALLRDPEWTIRRDAATSLRLRGRDAESAIPALIEALKDEEWQVRKQAVLALSSIAPQDDNVKAALQAMLRDPEDQVRRAARLALNRDQ